MPEVWLGAKFVRSLGGHSPWRNHKTKFSADSEGGDTLGAGTARGLRSQPVNTLALFEQLSSHSGQRVSAHHGRPCRPDMAAACKQSVTSFWQITCISIIYITVSKSAVLPDSFYMKFKDRQNHSR